jgi:acetyl esterase/lipase
MNKPAINVAHRRVRTRGLHVLIFLALALTSASATVIQTVEVYGHTAAPYAGIPLQWTSFILDTTVSPVPAVLVLHPGGYKTGNAGPPGVCTDLATSGFVAFATEYRLAPPGGTASNEMGNPPHPTPAQNDLGDDGHYPEQTTDVQMAIRAARADSRCNGKVYLVGGSAGASHSLYMAATGTRGDDQPDLIVLCSTGVSHLSDPNLMNIGLVTGETDPNQACLNYIPGVDPADLASRNWTPYTSTLDTASPWTYLKGANFAPRAMPPMFILISSEDSIGIPTSTGINILSYAADNSVNAVTEVGTNGLVPRLQALGWMQSTSPVPQNRCFKFNVWPVGAHEHAFAYWSASGNSDVPVGAKQTIITWLQAGVPTPLPTPTQTYLSGKARARVAVRRGS